jgi:hypothetical protein
MAGVHATTITMAASDFLTAARHKLRRRRGMVISGIVNLCFSGVLSQIVAAGI